MQEDHVKDLKAYQSQLVQQEFRRGAFEDVLEALPSPGNDQDRQMVAISHYELMKRDCANGHFASAREHAAAAEGLAAGDRSTRVFVTERLKLMRHRPRHAEVPLAFDPGLILIGGLGGVVVLGKYQARGRQGGLTEAVLLLKKAPEEMEMVQREVRPSLIDRLGLLMWDALRRSHIAASIDLVIPIPPDAGRYATRLYHPPEAIAKALANHSTIPCIADILVKLRPTRSLRSISDPSERAIEIEGSMGVQETRSHLLAGRIVLLVDDVVTYGTHFREAKRVLMEAGAASVYAAALTTAHGQPEPLPQ